MLPTALTLRKLFWHLTLTLFLTVLFIYLLRDPVLFTSLRCHINWPNYFTLHSWIHTATWKNDNYWAFPVWKLYGCRWIPKVWSSAAERFNIYKSFNNCSRQLPTSNLLATSKCFTVFLVLLECHNCHCPLDISWNLRSCLMFHNKKIEGTST